MFDDLEDRLDNSGDRLNRPFQAMDDHEMETGDDDDDDDDFHEYNGGDDDDDDFDQ